MKLWKATFNGVWLPGYGIVAAPDWQAAYEAMELELLKGRHGITRNGTLEVNELEIEDGQAVVLWNGDY